MLRKGPDLSSTEKRYKESVKKFEWYPTAWAEWNELEEFFAKFQASRGKETSDDNGSDNMTSKDEHNLKSDANLAQFCRKSLVGSYMWNYLADLLKIMKLREVGADDEKEVREIVQHLFAMCTVMIVQQMPTNCVLANDDRPYLLPHINLYLLMRLV